MMDFKEKYISATDAILDPASKKMQLSNDAYAIGEMIQNLIQKIEHARLSLMR